jgi:hypothetical protein
MSPLGLRGGEGELRCGNVHFILRPLISNFCAAEEGASHPAYYCESQRSREASMSLLNWSMSTDF